MKTIEYCRALKKKLGIASDYELAKRLDVRRQAISNYVNGLRAFDNTMAVKVAELLELDPMRVIADVELERGSNDELWKRIARKVAVVAGMAIVGSIAAPAPAEASLLQCAGGSVYYVKSRRLLGWLLGLPGFAGDDELPV